MSGYTIVGYCPRCGAPIYSPLVWYGVTPPPVIRSCTCFGRGIVDYHSRSDASGFECVY